MSREDNIKKIKDYLETMESIEDFCEKVIEEYRKYDALRKEVYADFYSFEIYDSASEIRYINICTTATFRNESDYQYINVPIEVFYDNIVEDYVRNLNARYVKKAEQEKKEKEEREKQKAVEEIKRLKEKYNI